MALLLLGHSDAFFIITKKENFSRNGQVGRKGKNKEEVSKGLIHLHRKLYLQEK